MKIALAFFCLATAAATTIDVYPSATDALATAVTRARGIPSSNVTILLHPGTHVLSTPLNLDRRDRGTTFRAASSRLGASISGGVAIPGWTSDCNNTNPELRCASVAFLGDKAQSRHLYISGQRCARGRIASGALLSAFRRPVSVSDAGYVVDVPLGAWANPGTVEMVFTSEGSQWTESRCTVNTTSSSGHVYMKQPCFANQKEKACGQGSTTPAYLENAGNVDAPGEWYHDVARARVLYWPRAGDDLSTATMPVVEALIVGAAGASDISFEGVTFEHSTWRQPGEGLGYVEQQSGALIENPSPGLHPNPCLGLTWKPMPSSLMFASGPRRVTFSKCTFRHLGSGAITFSGGAHDNLVTGCHFYDVSGTAVQLGRYDTFNITDPELQERRNTVTDSLIDGVAAEFHGNCGINVGYSANTTISHNEVRNLTYGGISIGWGWSRELDTYAGNQTIEFNSVHDFKTLLGDGGGIYALGPQQYSVMHHNWVWNMGSGRGGGGYYPDEGSAFWDIYANVFSNASHCEDNCQWLHIWTSSINHITTHDCFTDTATEEDNGTDCPQYNNTVVKPGGPWPAVAREIMEGAGTTTQF